MQNITAIIVKHLKKLPNKGLVTKIKEIKHDKYDRFRNLYCL